MAHFTFEPTPPYTLMRRLKRSIAATISIWNEVTEVCDAIAESGVLLRIHEPDCAKPADRFVRSVTSTAREELAAMRRYAQTLAGPPAGLKSAQDHVARSRALAAEVLESSRGFLCAVTAALR